MKKTTAIFGIVAVLAALGTGCAAVKPWQHGTLADPIMQAGRDPLSQAMIDHVWFSREAATGGRSVGGGGCGCN